MTKIQRRSAGLKRRKKLIKRESRKVRRVLKRDRQISQRLEAMLAIDIPGTTVQRVGNRVVRFSPALVEELRGRSMTERNVTTAQDNLRRAADMAILESPPRLAEPKLTYKKEGTGYDVFEGETQLGHVEREGSMWAAYPFADGAPTEAKTRTAAAEALRA